MSLFTPVEDLTLGVPLYGARRCVVDSDTWRGTIFFCGRRGVAVRRRHWSQKPTCPDCVAECRRLEIVGV